MGRERLSHRQESRERCKNDLYGQDGLSSVVELRGEVDRVQITLEASIRDLIYVSVWMAVGLP